MKNNIGDIVMSIFLLAIVFVLVKPGSLAPKFIAASGSGLQAIVEFAVSG